ncbi:xisI family protein [Lyngbya aestuarii BL J]|uniref:XisI family protein n=2 Tax=Lyngbya TaxID=28073 RepID=U7QQE6_9CYAN|nr:xisI family protein [Lyngbya aestuarii BL J]
MDTLNQDRQIIKQVLAANAKFYTHDEVEYKLVVDSEIDSYLIISLG